MKNKKTEFRFFTITEYEKEQEYLRDRHKNGWKFVNVVLPGIYYFEKCEPEDVIYQLDYNSEGLEHKEEYVQLFQDCHWEYLMDFAGYSYFRKPVSEMNGQEEIFCDDESRLEMIRRVFRGRMIPLILLFFCVIIPQLLMQFQLGGSINMVLFWIFVGIFLLYSTLFLQFGLQYWKMKKRQDY